jgi:hypothetical protein
MMSNVSFSCRICESRDFELLWDLKDAPYGDFFKNELKSAMKVEFHTFVLVRCKECKLLQLRDSTDIKAQYDDYLYSTKVTNALSDYYTQIASRLINEFMISSSSLVVDIGSNDGSFLSAFHSNLNRVVGVEPAAPASFTANNLGITTLNEYFTSETANKILEVYGFPKLISINYTLANIPLLSKFFGDLVSLMNDDSVLSIITGYHLDQFAVNMFDYIGHDHLTYLTLSDLDYLSSQFGLKLIDVSRSEHKGGSIHVTLARNSSQYEPRSSVKQLLQRESWVRSRENFGILELIRRIDEISVETENILDTYSTDPVYGVGASISTSYLLNYFGINGYMDSLYDDDPNKVGKFSPGSGIKVFGIDQIPKNPDSLVVILAWQHTNKILERLKQVGFAGKIFVPLPFPKFINP